MRGIYGKSLSLKALEKEGRTEEERQQFLEFLACAKKPKARAKLNYYLACMQIGGFTDEEIV